jgi:uroporphyrin-III C-methyltransferase
VTVHLVGAGPGDPELLTLRAARLLAGADVVVHDRLAAPVLALVPVHVARIDVGKWPGGSRTQAQINELLVELGRAGLDVVRLKGGDPFVFGRGGEEAEALDAAGIAWEVVPGVSSAFAAAAAAHVPVTHRGVSGAVTVVTGHRRPGEHVDWEAVARLGGTIVILMGVAERAEIAQRLIAAGRAPSTPVAVVTAATTADQRTLRTTLANLGAAEVASPSVIVVGDVAGLHLGGIAAEGLAAGAAAPSG